MEETEEAEGLGKIKTAEVIRTWTHREATAAADGLVTSRRASSALIDGVLTAFITPLTPDLYFESRRAASDPASQRGEVPVSGHVHTSSPQSRFAVFLPSQGVSL